MRSMSNSEHYTSVVRDHTSSHAREKMKTLLKKNSSDDSCKDSDTDSISRSSIDTLVDFETNDRSIKSVKRILGKLWRRHRGNVLITEYDPSYKVIYLGNVLTGWAKGEGCVEKPVSTLWRNYITSNRQDVSMKLTITNGGLTATTKDHGLTEYWANRVTYCIAPKSHPRLFVWVYRHEGRRLRPELRCHAALCTKKSVAERLASVLNIRLHQALLEFRRDKFSKQNARLSLANAVYENPSLPRRKILLSTGGANYRPPLERSKSAPKLFAIEEDSVAEEIEQKCFLDELRVFEGSEKQQFPYHDVWHLSQVFESLHRDYFEESASISSECDTVSSSNSEEIHSSPEESISNTSHNNESQTARNYALGPRRNSEGSPNFMTCSGSPIFCKGSENKNSEISQYCFETDSKEEEVSSEVKVQVPHISNSTLHEDVLKDMQLPNKNSSINFLGAPSRIPIQGTNFRMDNDNRKFSAFDNKWIAQSPS